MASDCAGQDELDRNLSLPPECWRHRLQVLGTEDFCMLGKVLLGEQHPSPEAMNVFLGFPQPWTSPVILAFLTGVDSACPANVSKTSHLMLSLELILVCHHAESQGMSPSVAHELSDQQPGPVAGRK